MAAYQGPTIPHIHLLCMNPVFSEAFAKAREEHLLPPSLPITIHNWSLAQLPGHVQFDTIVSPANSYGRLDGAFDDAISRAFAPSDDYDGLTRAAQSKLYEQWRGFAPPGSCTLLKIPEEFHERSRNIWGCQRVALCPTMRVPNDVRWDREVVYECVWSLLCAVDNHNRSVREGQAMPEDNELIRSILMTPLGTGVGRISPERWASQAVLAMKHFDDAADDPDKWSQLDWGQLGEYAFETEQTWNQDLDMGRSTF